MNAPSGDSLKYRRAGLRPSGDKSTRETVPRTYSGSALVSPSTWVTDGKTIQPGEQSLLKIVIVGILRHSQG
jgi:hypothetical protein